MTLSELIPTLRRSLPTGVGREPWPLTTSLGPDGELAVGGVSLTELAERYGTPTYLVDEADVRARCRAYRSAFPDGEVAYAGKAFLSRDMVRWIDEEGLSLDVCSAGELAVARSVGFPAERIVLHGNAKTPADIQAALAYGVGRIVIDSRVEIPVIAAAATGRQQVLVRVTPGVDAGTHAAVTTGVDGQKFGFPLSSGAAAAAVARVLAQPELELVGLHCHIGSQINRVDALELAARRLVALMAAVHHEHGLDLPQLDLGGGHAVPQVDGDVDFDLAGLANRLRLAISFECASQGLPVPRITVEPGRAIAARAGVTLYRVVTVKRSPGVRTFVAVDGGMGDNPRPALYGAEYTARLVSRSVGAPSRPMTIVGRYCEAGDVLARDVWLPTDLRPGDLLAVPCTGAYHHSMASTYNLVGRPPVVAVRDGDSRVLIRRETEEDLLRRDMGGAR